jgi:uncharacterized protein YuzE
VDLAYDSAADLLRLRLLELPTAQTEEVDSNAVIDWASDGRIVGLEVFGLTVFFAKPALHSLLEELDRLKWVASEISVVRGPPDCGGYLAETVGSTGVAATGATPLDALRSMLNATYNNQTV